MGGLDYGAAPGAVAEGYAQFAIGSLLVWFMLGLGMRRLFEEAREVRPLGYVLYIVVYCWSLHMIAQGFGAAPIPMAYTALPSVVLMLAFGQRKDAWSRNPPEPDASSSAVA